MSAGLKSAVAIMKMCVARRADGKPLFDFSHLNELSIKLHSEHHFNEEIGSVDPLCGLCNELEEMANKNAIETITIIVDIETDSNCARGDEWGRLDTALGQSGWPKLQRVSLAITIWSYARLDGELERALGNLPQTQFHKLTASKSLSFEFSVREELFDDLH
ncbi:hypothetical protein BJ912DRAFT_971761 [Pholiota molesta]|nr:hypothetical protein BJ912DRAFT_971761 [Pholiota molesta]